MRNANRNIQLQFIRGFVDADGGICRIEDYNELPKWFVNCPSLEVSQKSKPILEYIQSKLFEIGIKGNLYFHKQNKAYRLIITGKDKLLKCKKISIFTHPIKKKRLEGICLYFAPVAQPGGACPWY